MTNEIDLNSFPPIVLAGSGGQVVKIAPFVVQP